MLPIVKQCLDRLKDCHKTIDKDGNVHMRAESAIMIQIWMEHLANTVDHLDNRNEELHRNYINEIKRNTK